MIQLKVLTLVYRSYSGYVPTYLCDLIQLPKSATSLRPLRSLDPRHDLLAPRARTAKAKTLAFAFIGLALWNQLSPSTRSVLLTGGPSTSCRCLKTTLFLGSFALWKWPSCAVIRLSNPTGFTVDSMSSLFYM